MFRDTGHKQQPGHVVDTTCKPDITAAFEGHWKDGLVQWPFIRLAGETASVGKTHDKQKNQAISYLHYLLLARPDLYVAQGVTFLFGIRGKGIRQFDVTTKTLTSYYIRSYIACISLATSQIHRISRPSSMKKPRQDIP